MKEPLTTQLRDRHAFVSPNGDRLDDLNSRKETAQARLNTARARLSNAEEALRPLRSDVSQAEGQVMNLSCRLNTWWNAYRTATEGPRRHKNEEEQS